MVTLIERSFWERLTDHHSAAPERVWGTAYRIKADRVAEVKEYLDIREINGYTIHYTPFHPAPSSASISTPIRTLVYIGTPDNEQFVGPQDPQALAEHIYRSEGPSGLNRDYLWELEKALDGLSPESGDQHISDLGERLRAIAKREGLVIPDIEATLAEEDAHEHDFRKVSSVDEQEETEKTA